MRDDKRSKQELNSTARVVYIDVFKPSQIQLTENDGKVTAKFTSYKYTDFSIQLSPVEDGVIRKFPMIIRGDGQLWDLGNLYLIHKFTELAKVEPPSILTITHIAKQLMMYLRWIEHSRAESTGPAIHELYFPEEEQERVTWRYHRYLRLLIRKPDRPISVGTAKARMAAVVGFYRGIIEGNLVREGAIAHAPYEAKAIGIPVVNSVGLQFIKQVQTTDFTFMIPRRTSVGVIQDGGDLRPLSDDEQDIMLKALAQTGNRAFELMVWIALFTGARIQTVCTLRIKHIKQLKKAQPINSELILPIGPSTDCDTKRNVNYRLHFPLLLVDALHDYIESDEHAERRAAAFYGNSDENYAFLTENGSAYYTSKREIEDRQEGDFSKRISAKDRVRFTITDGNAVRNYLRRLIKDIRREHPDFNGFRFHDLRATYGMNYVRDRNRAGVPVDIKDLAARMGHKNAMTTQGYLNYDKDNEMIDAAQAYHHDRLNRLLGGHNDD